MKKIVLNKSFFIFLVCVFVNARGHSMNKATAFQLSQISNYISLNHNYKLLSTDLLMMFDQPLLYLNDRSSMISTLKLPSNNTFIIVYTALLFGLICLCIIKQKKIKKLRALNHSLIEQNKNLQKTSKLKSQFISTASHELRTPLYGIIGLTALLIDNPSDKKRREYLDSLKFSGDYLLALINNVLQLSKIEANEVKLNLVPFDISVVIKNIVNTLHTKKDKNNNQIHVDIDPKLDTKVIGDSLRLSQILINLIGNALKFTKNGNVWIAIRVLTHSQNFYTVRFSIKDDGIGIPENKRDSIFDIFSQIENQTQENEGTGLGLAIVKKLIQLHQSRVYLKSKENCGSEFYFDLKFKRQVSEKISKTCTEMKNSSRKTSTFYPNQYKILIVDDNKINQITTRNILKNKGYICKTANNGVEALKIIKAEAFDLILMDINMPKMNGLDVTKKLRQIDLHIPIIALTAVDETNIKEKAIAMGMNDIIIKPYDIEHFLKTLIKNLVRTDYKLID